MNWSLLSSAGWLRVDHGQLQLLLGPAGVLHHVLQADSLGGSEEEEDRRRLQGRWGAAGMGSRGVPRLWVDTDLCVSGGQRNWVQVFCNGGVPTELALLYMIEVSAPTPSLATAGPTQSEPALPFRWVRGRSPSTSVISTPPRGWASPCWGRSPAAPGTPGRRRWGRFWAKRHRDSSRPGRKSRQVRSCGVLVLRFFASKSLFVVPFFRNLLENF